ncbi:hypothetical protein O181_125703, partial [Austropuccinia psidii MF-1]|nr:hypothetical protein [Austropuccinia psidii MF-1]
MCWWKTVLATLILTLCQTFAIFKKLGVEADELEGLLAQAAFHAPPNLGQVAFDQLVTAAILAKGDKKPSSTFVGQVIMNTSQRSSQSTQRSSPFIYWVSEPLDSTTPYSCLQSPHFFRPLASTNNVHRPPEHLVNKFGGSCFHCSHACHWQANCPHTKGVANPNPRPPLPGPSHPIRQGMPECQSQPLYGFHYQREHVSQLKFAEHGTADRVLIDT